MSNIKQIKCSDLANFFKKYPDSNLLDVRTEQEWKEIGKPDGGKIGIKTHFLSIQTGEERLLNENFIQEFQKLAANKEQPLLIICRSGGRSNFAAELLTQAGYSNCINIADGFEGNLEFGMGWKKNDLPCKK